MADHDPVALVRRPVVDVDPGDGDGVRQWIAEQVRTEVLNTGSVRPRVVLLGDGTSLTFDLDAATRRQPDRHAGATYNALAGHPEADRAIAVLGADIEDDKGARQAAVVFEEIRTGADRWWSVLVLGFRRDPVSGTGVVDPAWGSRVTADPSELWPFLREWTWPPRGARPADVGPVVEVDVGAMGAFGELDEGVPLPKDCTELAQLIYGFMARDLLTAKVSGTAVVRLAGRAWEVWVLDNELPAPLDEMIRWFANERLPPADGIGFAQLTVKSDDAMPVFQIVAERGGKQARTWAPLLFPNGPGTLPEVDLQVRLQMRDATPDNGWIGVKPKYELSFTLG